MYIKSKVNKFRRIVLTHKKIFNFFSEVYLFGSYISNDFPNDIDLLLVYDIYSLEVEKHRVIIESCFHNLLELPIDITLLSKQEIEQTKFLEKLRLYIKLK